MEIFLDRRSIRQIRQSAADAVEDGDTETLREDVFQALSDEQVEEIERHLDGGDLIDFLSDAIEEWDGEDVDELFEVLETHLSDVGVELKYGNPNTEEDDEEEEDESDDADSEDFDADADKDKDKDKETSIDTDMELPEEEL